MRTDHIFYKLFQTFPETLFELLGAEQLPQRAATASMRSRSKRPLYASTGSSSQPCRDSPTTSPRSSSKKIAREQLPPGETRRRVLEFIEPIIVYKLQYGPQGVRAMFTMDELEQTPYVQGLMAEARREVRRETLLQLLHEKFGPLGDELVQRIAAIQDEQQLSQLAITVLNAPDLESFCAQLQQ